MKYLTVLAALSFAVPATAEVKEHIFQTPCGPMTMAQFDAIMGPWEKNGKGKVRVECPVLPPLPRPNPTECVPSVTIYVTTPAWANSCLDVAPPDDSDNPGNFPTSEPEPRETPRETPNEPECPGGTD